MIEARRCWNTPDRRGTAKVVSEHKPWLEQRGKRQQNLWNKKLISGSSQTIKGTFALHTAQHHQHDLGSASSVEDCPAKLKKGLSDGKDRYEQWTISNQSSKAKMLGSSPWEFASPRFRATQIPDAAMTGLSPACSTKTPRHSLPKQRIEELSRGRRLWRLRQVELQTVEEYDCMLKTTMDRFRIQHPQQLASGTKKTKSKVRPCFLDASE